MKEVNKKKGLFAMECEMPLRPIDIPVGYYTGLCQTFGQLEQEEAVVRIIYLSQGVGQWVGVTWQHLVEMVREDVRILKEHADVEEYNFKEKQCYRNEKQRYQKFSRRTLGIYGLIFNEPRENLKESPKGMEPCTGVTFGGLSFLARGVRELCDSGFLRIQVFEKQEVFCPTKEMIDQITRAQSFFRLRA